MLSSMGGGERGHGVGVVVGWYLVVGDFFFFFFCWVVVGVVVFVCVWGGGRCSPLLHCVMPHSTTVAIDSPMWAWPTCCATRR